MKWTDKEGNEHSDYYLTSLQCALCLNCKHFIGYGSIKPTCEAFQNGISKEVWTGEINHENNVEGDHGIKFEQAEDVFVDEDIVLIDEEW